MEDPGDMHRWVAVFVVLATISAPAVAATLSVDVVDARGQQASDAVVYAIPVDRAVPPARRTAVMDQRNRTFLPHILAIQTGTAVSFPNSDDIRHQVYSFSQAKTFQLPLYKGTPSNPIVFDKAGVATLGCNIHDRMSAYIVVVDTPHFAVSNGKGPVTLTGLSEGKYVVHVWLPEKRAEPSSIPVTLNGGRTELKFTIP